MNVGNKVRDYIVSNGISQSYLSRKTGIALPKLNLALNGKRKLTFNEYEEICWVLGVDIGAFLAPHPPNA